MAEQIGNLAQADKVLRRADARWQAALEGMDSYIERLQRVAQAAGEEHKALIFADLSNAPWSPIDVGGANYKPAEHLEPGKRPGPDAIWKDFDTAIQQLGLAFGGPEIMPVAMAFWELSRAAANVADKLIELGVEQPQPNRQAG
jgi:hypothetical protein